MQVLGIDTSTSCTGWCVMEHKNSINTIIAFGKIQPKKDLNYLEKYKIILVGLRKIVKQYKIEKIAMEQPNSSRNMKVTRILCGLYGLLTYMFFHLDGIIVVDINTIHAKKVFTGIGKAQKIDTINKANELFNLKLAEDDNDIADAIQIAFTYCKENFQANKRRRNV